jgi:hypothetical protein
MAGLLPYRTGKRKAKCNASVKAFAGSLLMTWRRHNVGYP